MYFGVIAVFVCGAVLGNWSLERFGLSAIGICSLLLLAAFFMMFSDREAAGECETAGK